MTTFTAILRAGDRPDQLIDPATPETLRPLLAELNQTAESSASLVLTDVEDGDRRATATRLPGGRWEVELAQPDQRLRAGAPNADATFDILRSWAADDGWWAEAFSWHPAGN